MTSSNPGDNNCVTSRKVALITGITGQVKMIR